MRRGMTLAEVLLSVCIMLMLLTAVYTLMGDARTAYYTAQTGSDLRTSLRQSMQKMEMELRNTGYDGCGQAMFTIASGTGVNGTDTIRFSIPVICSTGATLLDCNGAQANCDASNHCTAPNHFISPGHWGAPLTWGCNSSTCMDADNNCATVEYQFVQYALNNSGQLMRNVLSPALAVVATQTLGQNITAVRFALSGGSTSLLTLSLTAVKNLPMRDKKGNVITVTETLSQNVELTN